MKKHMYYVVVAVLMLCFSMASAESTGTDSGSQVRPQKGPYQLKPGEVMYNGKVKSAEEVRRQEEFLRLQAAKENKANLQEVDDKYSGEADRDALKQKLLANRGEFKEKVKLQQEAFREKLKTERQAFLDEVKAKKEEWKNANPEKKRGFWNAASAMLGQRFESAVTNLERMQTRVGEFIDKLEADGKDTAAATDFLDDSKAKLAQAKTKLAEVKKLLPASGEAVTAETFEKIKLGAREAKDLIKESHNALVEAIKEVKSLRDNSGSSDEGEDNDDSN